jgi:hypothetical protein
MKKNRKINGHTQSLELTAWVALDKRALLASSGSVF